MVFARVRNWVSARSVLQRFSSHARIDLVFRQKEKLRAKRGKNADGWNGVRGSERVSERGGGKNSLPCMKLHRAKIQSFLHQMFELGWLRRRKPASLSGARRRRRIRDSLSCSASLGDFWGGGVNSGSQSQNYIAEELLAYCTRLVIGSLFALIDTAVTSQSQQQVELVKTQFKNTAEFWNLKSTRYSQLNFFCLSVFPEMKIKNACMYTLEKSCPWKHIGFLLSRVAGVITSIPGVHAMQPASLCCTAGCILQMLNLSMHAFNLRLNFRTQITKKAENCVTH